ncbi:TIGR00645 family protein [Thiotrichales bacterium HSG1]|nr:TIGR00645 family protein [Thiotrichales bacterium HSG1]
MLKKIADFIENLVEVVLFGSRWLLAPFYIGLVGALLILLVKFVKKLFYVVPTIADASSTELILSILSLIDIVLVANLLLIIILSGYENFVSKIDAIKDHVDRPEWMGKVDYAGLKLKVISSIVAISSIELLKIFIHISEEGNKSLFTGNSLWEIEVFWLIILHLTFVASGLIFALTEKAMHSNH